MLVVSIIGSPEVFVTVSIFYLYLLCYLYMNYWLFKTEPTSYSIDDLQKEKSTLWTGIRNYQVRNFLRDDIKKGDQVLIYHSSSENIGIVGLAEVIQSGIPDPTAFDPTDHHFDPKSDQDKPTWYCVKIKFDKKFKRILSLKAIKEQPELLEMKLLQKGSRLSISPVTKAEYQFILNFQ
jgi:predicted RNA-binding protein with PUA-like domain